MVRVGEHYKLESWHNGLSYELTNLADGTSTFVQGDDASVFLDDLELIENNFPDWPFDRVAAWLWDQCEYGSIAS